MASFYLMPSKSYAMRLCAATDKPRSFAFYQTEVLLLFCVGHSLMQRQKPKYLHWFLGMHQPEGVGAYCAQRKSTEGDTSPTPLK